MTDLTEHEVLVRPGAAPEVPAGRSTGWWAMVLFISTESATFASLIASTFYLRFSAKGSWPPSGEKEPSLVLPTIATVVILVSCLPMALGSLAAARGSRAGGLLGSLGALAGGIAFLVLQVVDWISEWPDSTISKDAYGSLFYGLTALHALHVLIGVGMLIFLVASLAVRRAAARPRGPVSLVAIYWYFMGVVAVAVYLTAYLSSTLWATR